MNITSYHRGNHQRIHRWGEQLFFVDVNLVVVKIVMREDVYISVF